MMQIERATWADADRIGEVHSVAWKDAYRGIFPPEYLEADTPQRRKEEFLSALDETGAAYYVVKMPDVAGVMKIRNAGGVCEIESLYVHPDMRGKGIGSAMILSLRERYNANECMLWVLSVNRGARRFYERLRFVDTGDRRWIERGEKFEQMKYRWTK